jgi:hypothetical protein
VLFAPVDAGPRKVPVWWGYTVPNLLLTTMSQVIQQSKLVVVLDLDQTLLLASTTETLSERLELVQKQK